MLRDKVFRLRLVLREVLHVDRQVHDGQPVRISFQVLVVVSDSGSRLTGGRYAEWSPDCEELDKDYSAGEIMQLNRRVGGKDPARVIRISMPRDKREVGDNVADAVSRCVKV